MQIIAALSSNAVLSTRSEPDLGQSNTVNGQFVIPTPPGVGVQVDSSSYLIPQDAGSVPGQIAAEFLARNPMFDHVIYNFLIQASDIAELDLSSGAPSPTSGNVTTGTLPSANPGPNGPRCQVGRGVGPGPLGQAPNSVALLAKNVNRASPTYGAVVSATVNLVPITGATGTDEVLVWWEIGGVDTSSDIVQGYGTTAGQNSPALRTLTEINQQPAGFFVYVSVDNGVTWHETPYLQPTDLVTAGTSLRIAFINQDPTQKVFLLSYMILMKTAP